MLKVILGEKGAGKSKRIIDDANGALTAAKGSIVYIDDDNRYMYDVKRQIRFIDASEYGIDSPKMFFGFICGLVAQDFDLEQIFIDGFLKIIKAPIEQTQEFFDHLENFAKRFNVRVTISINGKSEAMPEFLKRLQI